MSPGANGGAAPACPVGGCDLVQVLDERVGRVDELRRDLGEMLVETRNALQDNVAALAKDVDDMRKELRGLDGKLDKVLELLAGT